MATARIDGDVLVYEIAFAAQAFWKYLHEEKGEEATSPPPFEIVLDMMEQRIPYIIRESGADAAIMYLTDSLNFRNHIAKTTPYKQRVGEKPYHYKNIRAVLPTMYECKSYSGLEADDLISLALVHNPDDIAVSRDKDIRQVPGVHYSWELGERQPAIGPHKSDQFGSLILRGDKLLGYGDKYLYAQILTGDSVDSIPGCPKYGPKTAMKLLENASNNEECLNAIIPAYQKCYGIEWKSVLREQARLVHLVRSFKNGRALLWGFPDDDETWIDVRTGQLFSSPQDQAEGI